MLPLVTNVIDILLIIFIANATPHIQKCAPVESPSRQDEWSKRRDLHFSPSIEFENKGNRHGLSTSIVDADNENEFYIFYKRPKMVTKLFGLVKYMDDISRLTEQDKQVKMFGRR